MYCEKCGAEIKDGSTFCSSCGRPVSEDIPNQQVRQDQPAQSMQIQQVPPQPVIVQQMPYYPTTVQISDKSKGTAAVLAFFLGGLGAHRFYV